MKEVKVCILISTIVVLSFTSCVKVYDFKYAYQNYVVNSDKFERLLSIAKKSFSDSLLIDIELSGNNISKLEVNKRKNHDSLEQLIYEKDISLTKAEEKLSAIINPSEFKELITLVDQVNCSSITGFNPDSALILTLGKGLNKSQLNYLIFKHLSESVYETLNSECSFRKIDSLIYLNQSIGATGNNCLK